MKSLSLKFIMIAFVCSLATNNGLATNDIFLLFNPNESASKSVVPHVPISKMIVDLSLRNIHDGDLESVCQSFLCSTMSVLNLSHNEISDEGATRLCKYIVSHSYPNFSMLNLSSNNISQPWTWIPLLRETTIKTINLYNLLNRLSNEEACKFGESFKRMPIQTIMLGGNYLWIDTVNVILKNLTETNVKTVYVQGDITKYRFFELNEQTLSVTNSKGEKIDVKFVPFTSPMRSRL